LTRGDRKENGENSAPAGLQPLVKGGKGPCRSRRDWGGVGKREGMRKANGLTRPSKGIAGICTKESAAASAQPKKKNYLSGVVR